MEITEDKNGDIVILALSGRLDASTSKTFEISSGGHRFRRLEVRNRPGALEYVTGPGLGVFLVAAKRLTSSKEKIVLCSLKDHTRQVFDLADFSAILTIFGRATRRSRAYSNARHLRWFPFQAALGATVEPDIRWSGTHCPDRLLIR